MSNKLISWIIFIILCFIWGSSFILMSYSKEGLTASQIASFRIFTAGLVLIPLAFFHMKQIPRNKLITVIVAGLFGNLFPAYLFAIAITKNINSSIAGILNSLTPICVVMIGISFFKDRISGQKIFGVLVGFAGLVLLALTHSNINLHNFGFALLILVATIFYGVNINMVSHFLRGINPVSVAIISLSFLVIPTGILLWQEGFLQLNFANGQVQNALIASGFLGIAGSAIATALFYVLVQKSSGLFASLVTYGTPFVALFWGFVYGEKITLLEIGCLGIILLGVYLANRPEKVTVPNPG